MIGIRIAIAAALVAGAACKKEAPARTSRPAPISEPEIKRGEDACTSYLAKVCVCAKARPEQAELAQRCKLDFALIEALHLALEVDSNPEATPTDVWRAQDQARKIVANCLQSVNDLTAQGCR